MAAKNEIAREVPDYFRFDGQKIPTRWFLSGSDEMPAGAFDHGWAENIGMTRYFLGKLTTKTGVNFATYDHPSSLRKGPDVVQEWRAALLEAHINHIKDETGFNGLLVAHSQAAISSSKVAAKNPSVQSVVLTAPAITLKDMSYLELMNRGVAESIDVLKSPHKHAKTMYMIANGFRSIFGRLPELAAEFISMPREDTSEHILEALAKKKDVWVLNCLQDRIIDPVVLNSKVSEINEKAQKSKKYGGNIIRLMELDTNHMGILNEPVVAEAITKIIVPKLGDKVMMANP